ncbi:MAG: hypothetical protein CVU89_12435 [Firmicutes bacterium HGW-Firmicutes-14]|jgi:hypothetical protein|nr:MAG: hypothetical protein CVU89_12435 [Firmicutes bacterium HGW-Firmicutes-14]
MICERCKDEIPEEEKFEHMGQILCEDCYIEAIEPPRTCDVTAVYSAKIARKMAGQEGTDGLTELQKDIYNYVRDDGPVTHDQIMKRFKLAKWQLEKQFAVLRHCELLRGFKDGNQVFITIWEEGSPGELKTTD